jgi:ribosomal protein S18 acetylase RimI-like enzyme
MRVSPVTAAELDRFVAAGGEPAHHGDVRRYLEAMFAAGSMRPEWCFVAEKDGRSVGRIAFWTLPGMGEPFALVLFDVDRWADVETGSGLLDHALQEARELGSREIEHVLDDPPMPPQFQRHPEERVEMLEGAGFSMRRETIRFEWPGGEPPAATGRLRYRTLPEVGEEAFVEAIARVSEGTLDREILSERRKLGPEGAARDFFEDAAMVGHDPSWWRLAYDGPDGDLVGLIMPAQPPAFLTVFYIGVVPEMRGRGYVDDLLAAGTNTLLRVRGDGETPLRTDTDVSNAPMSAAFERAGWRRFARRREYVADLDRE